MTRDAVILILVLICSVAAASAGDASGWDALDLPALAELARRSQPFMTRAEQRELAEHVAGRYGWAWTTGSTISKDLLDLAVLLGPDLPPTSRGTVAEALREQLASRGDSPGEAPNDETARLCRVLRAVGDEDLAERLALRWIAASDEGCDAMSIRGLADLSCVVAKLTTDEGKAARRRLAGTVTNRVCAAAPDSALPVAGWAWYELVCSLASDLSAAQRRALLAGLRPSAELDMSSTDFAGLASSIRVLDRRYLGPFTAGWMEGHDGWQSWQPAEIELLARALGDRDGCRRAHRLLLVRHLSEGLLTDEESLRSTGPRTLLRLVRALEVDLSERDRSRWFRGLARAFDGHDPAGEDFVALAAAVCLLERYGGPDFVGRWLQARDCWRTWPPGHQALIGEYLRTDGRKVRWAKGELTGHLLSTTMSDAAAIRSADHRSLEAVARSIAGGLTDRQREVCLENLTRACATIGPDGEAPLSIVRAARYLDRDRGCRFAVDWVDRDYRWLSWSCRDLSSLLQAMREDRSEAAEAARRRVARQGMSSMLSDEGSSRFGGDIPQAYRLALTFSPHLLPQDRSTAVVAIRDAFVPNDEALPATSPKELTYLAHLLKRLGDPGAQALVDAWCAKVSADRPLSPDDLVSLARGHLQSPDDAHGASLQRLAASIPAGTIDPAELWLHFDSFVRFALHFAGHMTQEARDAWAAGIWVALEEHLQSRGEFDSREIAEAVCCLEALGAEQLAGLVGLEDRLYREGLMDRRSPSWRSVRRDLAWTTFCWRAIAARSHRRLRVWREGLEALPPHCSLPAEDVLAVVDRLVRALDADDSGDLSPERALGDLVRACGDGALLNGLRARLTRLQLDGCCLRLPAELRGATIRAEELAEAGRPRQAAGLYEEVLDELAQGGHLEAAGPLHARALELLLVDQTVDCESAGRHLQALAEPGACPPERLFNLQLRLLLNELSRTGAEDRRDVWVNGLARLCGSGMPILDDTFADLDRTVETVGRGDPAIVEQILTDLLVLLPDINSMAMLQRRRARIFADRGRRPEAEEAALCELVLSCAGPDGPLEAIGGCVRPDRASGVEPDGGEILALFGRAERRGPRGETPATSAPTTSRAVDPMLMAASQRLLAAEAAGLSRRRRAFLNLFAGNRQDALRDIRLALRDGGSGFRDVARRLDDAVAVLSIAEGRLCGVTRATAAHTHGARASDIARYTALWQRRLARWGLSALSRDMKGLCGALWARATSGEVNIAGVSDLVDYIVLQARYAGATEALADGLMDAAARIDEGAVRACLLGKAAAVYCERRMFGRCLDALDRSEALAGVAGGQRALSAALLRAECLLAAGDFDRAADLLAGDAGSRDGTTAELSRAALLLGYARLRQGRTEEAAKAFRRILDEFPYTDSALKANSILERLRGRRRTAASAEDYTLRGQRR